MKVDLSEISTEQPDLALHVRTKHPTEAHWASSERKFGCGGRKMGIEGKSTTQAKSKHKMAVLKTYQRKLAMVLDF